MLEINIYDMMSFFADMPKTWKYSLRKLLQRTL